MKRNTVILCLFVVLSSAFCDLKVSKENLAWSNMRFFDSLESSSRMHPLFLGDTIKEYDIGRCSQYVFGDTCYEILPDDIRYRVFGKDGVTVRDTIHNIYQYKDIRFYWDGCYECFSRIPENFVCSGLFDCPGDKEFILKSRGISIAICAQYNVFEDDFTREEWFQRCKESNESSGDLFKSHYEENVFIFEGKTAEHFYYTEKDVFYTNSSGSHIIAQLIISYPKESEQLAKEIIPTIFPLFPNKPF